MSPLALLAGAVIALSHSPAAQPVRALSRRWPMTSNAVATITGAASAAQPAPVIPR